MSSLEAALTWNGKDATLSLFVVSSDATEVDLASWLSAQEVPVDSDGTDLRCQPNLGGYKDDDTLSRITLSWMWNEMKVAGLAMKPLTEEQASIRGGNLTRHKPHRSTRTSSYATRALSPAVLSAAVSKAWCGRDGGRDVSIG